MIESVFAPDWRHGVQYQSLLAEALPAHGVRVSFLADYKRILPLRRLMASRRCEVLHLHWPEAYYPAKGDVWDWFRRFRFPFDLAGVVRHHALAVTAHNLHAHNRAHESFVTRNSRAAFRMARVVFAHSGMAKQRLIESFGLAPEKIRVIPHGDLSVTLGAPVSAAEARAVLGLNEGRVAVMFGAVEPYKGQEEVIAWWKQAKPDATLAIVGKPHTDAYRAHISHLTEGVPNIVTHLHWLDDAQLKLWLCASDAAIFNYRQIFTSGAANLARSWGLPMLIPKHLDTVELDEPTPFVQRFDHLDSDFGAKLDGVFRIRPDFAAAAPWRAACTWDTVARLTADGYRMALAD